MTLYLYDTESGNRLQAVEAVAYDQDSFTTPEGSRIFMGDDVEFSSLPDCSEPLRADCKAESYKVVWDAMAAAYSEGVQQA